MLYHKARLSWVLVLVLAVVVMTSHTKGDFSGSVICSDSAEQSKPALSGNFAVWLDLRNGSSNKDLFGYDFTGLNEVPICTAAGNQDTPAISGNLAVWCDNRNGNNDIYGFYLPAAGVSVNSIQGGEIAICTAAASQDFPAVSNNIVVWRDKRNGNNDIYGIDINTLPSGSDFPICTNTFGQYTPSISGNIVVWMDNRNENNDIYGYNLTTQTEFPVCTDPSGQYNPRIDGNIVVWTDDRNGNTDIYGIDITTLPGGSAFAICLNGAAQSNPTVSGANVIWEDQRNGNFDIYGYNLAAHNEFSVVTAAGDQKQPAIDGRRIVWQDSANSGDIYTALIPEPVVLTLLAPNGGEIYQAGGSCAISWQSSGPLDQVKIEYSSNAGGDWSTLDPNTANDGQWLWQPLPDIDSSQCRIRLSDPLNPATGDLSDDNFIIFQCLATLTADLNGDCLVDLADLALFSRQWLDCGNPYDTDWCN